MTTKLRLEDDDRKINNKIKKMEELLKSPNYRKNLRATGLAI